MDGIIHLIYKKKINLHEINKENKGKFNIISNIRNLLEEKAV